MQCEVLHCTNCTKPNRLVSGLNGLGQWAAHPDHKVDILANQEQYDGKTKTRILKHLHANANETFLWVALVVQYLTKADVKPWRIDDVLGTLPPGMDELYQRMLSELRKSLESKILQHILTMSAVVFRPLMIVELKVYLDDSFPEYHLSLESITKLIEDCGSFLTIQDGSIQFMHASAQEYILTSHQQELFPDEKESLHLTLFCTSIKAMSAVLRKDMYNLQHPGTHIDDISLPSPDPLQGIGYSCTQFLSHFAKAGELRHEIRGSGLLHTFMLSHYVYWLEAMSLLRDTIQANIQIADLYTFLRNDKV